MRPGGRLALAALGVAGVDGGVVDVVVQPMAAGLRGSVPGPADRRSAELALLLSALADPGRELQLHAPGLPRPVLTEVLTQLGVPLSRHGNSWHVRSVGVEGLRPAGADDAGAVLDCGRSAVALASLIGLLSGQPFSSTIHCDETLARRLAGGLCKPPRLRGAQLEGRIDPQRIGELAPPIHIEAAPLALSELDFAPNPGDWLAKVSALLSGLRADGDTQIREQIVSDERCERLLRWAGWDVASAGPFTELTPRRLSPHPAEAQLPADPDAAGPLLAAGLLVPESVVSVRSLALSGSRRGWLEALRNAGASVVEVAKPQRLGEAVAEITVAGQSSMRGLQIGGEIGARAGMGWASLACLAVASRSGASSLLQDVADDPQWPQQREGMQQLLTAFGVGWQALPGRPGEAAGLQVEGCAGRALRACEIDSAADGQLAMAACVLALRADGPCRITNAGVIAERFPRFIGSLRALGARVDLDNAPS